MKSLVLVVAVIMFSVLNAQKNITTKPTYPVPAQNVKNYIGADGLAAWVKSWLGVLSQEIYTARIKDENLTAEVEGLQRSNAILVAEMQQVQRSFNKTLQGVEQKVKNSLLTDASMQAENVALTNQVATLKQQLQQLKDFSQRERTLLTNKIQSLEQQQHMLVQQTSNAFDQLLAGPIRLVNGSHSQEGRIEVFYNGQWGTVCDDRFDVKDARVACRQLGYPSAYPTVYERARFGQGTDPIWLDGLDCVGSELDIRLCKHNGWGKHNCGHHEDVGVSC